MKILVTSIGTRGDMEPFLAIGEILQEQGHEIVCAFPEQFGPLAESSGFTFCTLGPEFMEMLESDTGKLALGSGASSFRKFWAYFQLAIQQAKINKGLITKSRDIVEVQQPDYIIHNGKATYPVMWETKNLGKTVFVSPVPYLHYVKGHTHLAFKSNWGKFLNKLTYWLADWGLLSNIMGSVKTLGLKDVSKSQVKNALQNHKVIYTISPQLFERPPYWNSNLHVLGYHERNKVVDWQPSPELEAFLAKNEKVALITFGSMTNPNPKEKTQMWVDILQKNGIAAIINTADGGLTEVDYYDDSLIHFVSLIPYGWLLPKMYAVVHHGGSGTTHSALKYGCAMMIVPHIIDQFVWNKMLHEKGVGPLGPEIGKLKRKNVEHKFVDLMQNVQYKKRAEELGEKLKGEDYKEALITAIFQ